MKSPFLFFFCIYALCIENIASIYEYNLRSCSTELELIKKDIQILQAKMRYLETAIQNEELIRKYELIPTQNELAKTNKEIEKKITKMLSFLKINGIEIPEDL